MKKIQRLGYIVPEFPGQTHAFFWREVKRLEEMGIDVDIVSTRSPPLGIQPHSWSEEAAERTTYLANGSALRLILNASGLIKMTSASGWAKCLRYILRSRISLKERIRLLALLIVAIKLNGLARRRRWDHMHVHSCANAANIAAFASFLSGVPYSMTLHGALEHYGANQSQKWENAQFGITVSRALHNEIEKFLGPHIATKTCVAPMGVNIDVFKRDKPYISWVEGTPAQIYSVGRLNPGKGHQDLIKAICLLRQRGIDAYLTIAGQDEAGGTGYFRTLKSTIDDLGLSEFVLLPGALSQDAIITGLLSSHVFVLASHDEAIGVATMEAMALELPLVATAVGGVPELVEHGTDGLLISPSNPAELSGAIETILKNSNLAYSFSRNSRAKISKCFHDKISAQRLIKCANGNFDI